MSAATAIAIGAAVAALIVLFGTMRFVWVQLKAMTEHVSAARTAAEPRLAALQAQRDVMQAELRSIENRRNALD